MKGALKTLKTFKKISDSPLYTIDRHEHQLHTDSFIASECVNTGRQFEVDCVKFFAIFFMICIHVYEQLGNYDYHTMMPEGFFRNAMEFLGGPMAAPVFMFTMGIGMVYTRHNSPGAFIKRGWKLLFMGFALNFFRETLLEILGNVLLGMDYSFEYIADGFLNIDILQFSGMTFLVVGFLKKAGIGTKRMLMIGVLMQAIGMWASHLTFSSVIHGNLLGLLLPTGEKVAFPFSLWCLYPLLGMIFAEYLQRVCDKDRFYRIILISGVVVALAFTSCFCWIGYDIRYIYALAENSYYHQTFIGVVWIGAFVLIALSISHFLLGKMEQTKAGTFICFCSRNLNVIYIIQWLIIAWTVAFVTAMNIEVKLWAVEIILVGLLISLLSIGMIALWKRMRRRDSFCR